MDYNTEREKLILPEYGRYVHDYIEIIKTLPTKDERNKAAGALVNVMAGLNHSLRESSDFKRKLWDHLIIMANFDLDIAPPFPMPDQQMMEEKPERIDYDNVEIKKKHYGKVLERIIQHIPDYEGDKRKALISLIANAMKKNYINWNKGSVNDLTILNDLKEMCPACEDISNEIKLAESRDLVNKPKNNGQKNSKTTHNKNRKQNNNKKPTAKK